MKILPIAVATLVAAGASAAAFEEVYRCTAPTGAVTYQPMRCPAGAFEKRLEVTPVNAEYDAAAETARLFLREGELDRRLQERSREAEAQREATAVEEQYAGGSKAGRPQHLPSPSSNEARHSPTQLQGPVRNRAR